LQLCQRLFSPMGCVVCAVAFGYNGWCHISKTNSESSTISAVAYILACSSSASVGMLLCGRFLRRNTASLSMIGAQVEAAGMWWFLHLDLHLLTAVLTTSSTLFTTIAVWVGHTSHTFSQRMKLLGSRAEEVLDALRQRIWMLTRYIWQQVVSPLMAGVFHYLWAVVRHIWDNPLYSIAASGGAVAIVYQVHIGRLPCPDMMPLLSRCLPCFETMQLAPRFLYSVVTAVLGIFATGAGVLCQIAESFATTMAIPTMAKAGTHTSC